MLIDLMYGNTVKQVNIDEEKYEIHIIHPVQSTPIIKNVDRILEDKLRNSLPNGSNGLFERIKEKSKQLGRPLSSIAIVVSDSTRPVPTAVIIKPIIDVIRRAASSGICDKVESCVKFIIATGLHRPNTEEELIETLGQEIRDSFKVIQHNARDNNTLKLIGKINDENPISGYSYNYELKINKVFAEADFKIITGFIEPHFFAGFSGGPKAVLPGISSMHAVISNHRYNNIVSEYATFGEVDKNPIYKEMIQAATMVGVDYALNVLIGHVPHKSPDLTGFFTHSIPIVGIAAGDWNAVSTELISELRKRCFQNVEQADIAIVTNGGAPLDLNLYQGVKGMKLGSMALKNGGSIIYVGECKDGIGHGDFKDLIFNKGKANQVIQYLKSVAVGISGIPEGGTPSGRIPPADAWQVQILADLLTKFEIYVVSSLLKSDLGNIGLKWGENIENCLNEILIGKASGNKKLKILVMPAGAEIIPDLKQIDAGCKCGYC